MSQPFESVREQLLCAGIAPRHVRRYLRELSEHLTDLTAREMSAGHDAEDAAIRARAGLGTDTELVSAMTGRPEFRAFSVRAPWAVFCCAPLVAVLAVFIGLACLLAALIFPYIDSQTASQPMPMAFRAAATAVTFAANFLIGPLAAIALAWMALRQRLSLNWPLTGIVAIAVTAALFTMNIHLPSVAHPHAGEISVGFAPYLFGHETEGISAPLGTAFRVLLTLVPAVLLYRTMRVRLMPDFV